MAHRVYISNISPSWPIADQQRLMAEHLPDWARAVYTDVLKPRALRDRDPEKLTERTALCRPTGRRDGVVVHVATLAIVAWRQSDFRNVLEALAARGDSLIAHEEGRTFDLRNPLELDAAVALFPHSRTHSGRRKGRLIGSQAAAVAKLAASKADADKIRSRWGVPPNTAVGLCAEVGRSYQTMKRQLGKWEHAVRKRERNAKRAAQKAAEGAKGNQPCRMTKPPLTQLPALLWKRPAR